MTIILSRRILSPSKKRGDNWIGCPQPLRARHVTASHTRHLILITFGSAGDINPMIALGKGLVARGHRVTIVTNDYFADYVAQAGAAFIGLGRAADHQEVMDNPDLWHPRRSFDVIADYALLGPMRPTHDLITGFDPAETALITSGLVLGAHLARESHGFRHATVHLQPSLFRSVYDPPVLGGFRLPDWLPHGAKRAYFSFLDRALIDRRLAPVVNAFRAELGLPPAYHLFGDFLHSPDLNIGLFPEWFARRPPDWPEAVMTGFIGYDASDQVVKAMDLNDILTPGERPLVFTPGSANVHAGGFFRESAAAARLLNRPALLLSPYADQIPAGLPDNVHHFSYAPFSQLLPRAAALIYHGGVGTMAQALAAGVPHLVMPLSHDQPDNARRLEHLGVGLAISPKRYRADRVAAGLDRLLGDDQVADNCRRLAQRIDFTAGLAAACEAIAKWLEQRALLPV
jgi:rhamnosyltransferase subunit B